MRLTTRVTIGKNPPEEFLSSEVTLTTNVYATLRIRGVHVEICKRAYDAIVSGDIEKFRFEERGVVISAERAPPDRADIEKAHEAVDVVDLHRMAVRVQREHADWNPERVASAIEQYRRFLIMAMLFPDDEIMPISEDMDHVWHAHILHTTQYEEDCQMLFGEFLHHEPADSPIPPFDLRERTRALHLMTFGIDVPEDDGFCSIDRLQQRKVS